jgi:hypothetical protein
MGIIYEIDSRKCKESLFANILLWGYVSKTLSKRVWWVQPSAKLLNPAPTPTAYAEGEEDITIASSF